MEIQLENVPNSFLPTVSFTIQENVINYYLKYFQIHCVNISCAKYHKFIPRFITFRFSCPTIDTITSEDRVKDILSSLLQVKEISIDDLYKLPVVSGSDGVNKHGKVTERKTESVTTEYFTTYTEAMQSLSQKYPLLRNVKFHNFTVSTEDRTVIFDDKHHSYL